MVSELTRREDPSEGNHTCFSSVVGALDVVVEGAVAPGRVLGVSLHAPGRHTPVLSPRSLFNDDGLSGGCGCISSVLFGGRTDSVVRRDGAHVKA